MHNPHTHCILCVNPRTEWPNSVFLLCKAWHLLTVVAGYVPLFLTLLLLVLEEHIWKWRICGLVIFLKGLLNNPISGCLVEFSEPMKMFSLDPSDSYAVWQSGYQLSLRAVRKLETRELRLRMVGSRAWREEVRYFWSKASCRGEKKMKKMS